GRPHDGDLPPPGPEGERGRSRARARLVLRRAAGARAALGPAPAGPRPGRARPTAAAAGPRPRGRHGGLRRPRARGPRLRPQARSPRPQHDPGRGGGRHPERRAPARARAVAVIVMKFGGTSVGSAERIRAVADRVRERLDQKPVVVVSALGGVTDLLIRGARFALHRDPAAEAAVRDVVTRHGEAIRELVPAGEGRHRLLAPATTLPAELKMPYTRRHH